MELIEKIRRFENLHIVFWLFKDSCWMLELKWLGALMILPTLFLAIYIVIKSRHLPEFYINMAILFWISANSFWMLMEFFNANELKNYSSLPFVLGFVCVGIFYFKQRQKRLDSTDSHN